MGKYKGAFELHERFVRFDDRERHFDFEVDRVPNSSAVSVGDSIWPGLLVLDVVRVVGAVRPVHDKRPLAARSKVEVVGGGGEAFRSPPFRYGFGSFHILRTSSRGAFRVLLA